MLVRFCEKIFHPRMQHFILGVIIFNALTLGLETSRTAMSAFGTGLIWLDHIALGIFVVELLMKIMALRLGFFKDPWNVFDFLVVGISLVPASGPLAILRALRILRVLRLVSNLPRLRVIAEGIFRALPSLGWLFLLLFLIFYVFAVLATNLFGAQFEEWFGSLNATLYTLFQLMTLDSWSMGIVRPLMEQFPYAYLLFIPFIIITAFIVLNVFIGIIVSTMSAVSDAETQRQLQSEEKDHAELFQEFARLKKQLDKIESLLPRQRVK